MKISRKRFNNIIRKGVSLALCASMVLTGITTGGIQYAQAAISQTSVVTHGITEDVIKGYEKYMIDRAWTNTYFNQDREGRIKMMIYYLNSVRNETGLPSLSIATKSDGSLATRNLVWDPSYEDLYSADNQLYMLRWVNGNEENPGRNYNFYGRIVYLTDDYRVYCSQQVKLDAVTRDYTDLTWGNQFDYGRVNQCTVMLPNNCKQILGFMICNEEGGGDDNDPWNMSSLTFTRVKDDSLFNIGQLTTDSMGNNYRPYTAGEITSRVCNYDINKAYLGGYDVNEEWLYLLETPLIESASGDSTDDTQYEPPLQSEVASYVITADVIEGYQSYAYAKGYTNRYFNENRKGRAQNMVNYLNTVRMKTGLPYLEMLADEDGDIIEKKLIWNPDPKKYYENTKDLYMLEWVNSNKDNPGRYFNFYGRVLYLTKDLEVAYSQEVNLDDVTRDYTDLTWGNQFDYGRVNQCTVLMPDDCKQILGLMIYNNSGGGDDNNPWNMSSLTFTKIENNDFDNIGKLEKNELGKNYHEVKDGYITARVSGFDINKAYLGGSDKDEEWLYLLETPLIKFNPSDYTCLRVTTGNTDLGNTNLKITLDYIDISGNTKTESFDFSEKNALKNYPKLIHTWDFSPEDDDVDNFIKNEDKILYSVVTDFMDALIAHSYIGESSFLNALYADHTLVAPLYYYSFSGGPGGPKDGSKIGDPDIVNKISMEVVETLNTRDNKDTNDILRHMMDYGDFRYDYDFDSADTTQTNLYGAVYFGNFIDHDVMTRNFLGPYTATDMVIYPSSPIASVSSITVSQTNSTVGCNLQNISVFTADRHDFDYTRMNGGMSSERIFEIEDGRLIAEVQPRSGGIQLVGNTPAVCKEGGGNNPLDRNDHGLVNYPGGKTLNNFSDNDNLGIEIDITDIYEAGLEVYAAANHSDFFDFSDGLLDNGFWTEFEDLYDPDPSSLSFIADWWSGSMASWEKLFPWLEKDPLNSTADIKNYMLQQLSEVYRSYGSYSQGGPKNIISRTQALSFFNLMDSYYKDPIVLDITYIDESNCRRKVEIPLVTIYALQLYSDNSTMANSGWNHLFGIFQQGQLVGVRIPLSRYDELVEINVKFGGASSTISSFRSNKFFYEPTEAEIEDYSRKIDVDPKTPVYDLLKVTMSKLKPYDELGLKDNETIRGGALIPTYDTLTIDSIQIYEHVTPSTFKNTLNQPKHYVDLTKPSAADYHFEAKSYDGYTLTSGSALLLTTTSETTGKDPTLSKGALRSSNDFYENLYLVEIIGTNLRDKDNAEDLLIQLNYTTEAGEQMSTEVTNLSALSQDYYGTIGNYLVPSEKNKKELVPPDETHHTSQAMQNGSVYYTVRLSGVKTFDSITIEIPDGYPNGWQVNEVNVKKLTELSQRYSDRPGKDNDLFTKHPNFNRDHSGDLVAFNNRPVALHSAGMRKTFNFTIVNPDGTFTEPGADTKVDTDTYTPSGSSSMTYEETMKNLGLSMVRYQYSVRVDVADITDAGSSNYFYFQLVFENGTSGVVLANQQLASDSFRQGQSESFTIKTTQNYGELKGIRVICDASSASSQTFDKLNIDSVTVSLANKGGIQSWIIENVGWIDINYRDDGIYNSVTATIEEQGFTNEQVVNEFPVTRRAAAARLLFNITTSASSSSNYIAQHGKYEGVLTYLDTAGYTKTYNFDLLAKIEEFNGSGDREKMLRPNMSNYFSLMLTDISSIKSLTIYRSNGLETWQISNVVISQVGELGDSYLSSDNEYKRYIEDETHLAESSNINQSVLPTGNASFTFSPHTIEVETGDLDPSSWTTTITRIPTSNKESFNVYLLPGGSYSFSKNTVPNIQGVLDYTFKTGNALGQEAFVFNDTGEINGTTVLKATGIKISDMNALKKLHLKYNGSSEKAPVISGAKVERVRDNTIIDTYYFDFLSAELTNGITNTAIAKADTTASDTVQTVVLNPTEGQNFVFTPSSSDVAVSLLYRSENDAESQTAYFASPYKFLTDAEITLINSAMPVEIPFEVSGVSEVVGIAVIGSGPNVQFENAMVYNYINNNGSESLLNVCQIAEEFTATTIRQTFLADEDSNVSPVTFTFHTSSDDNFAGAGTSGTIPITINYTDTDGLEAEFRISSISDYLPANTVPEADSKISFTVMLNNLGNLDSVDISVENDSWHLTKVVAEITTVSEGSGGKDKLVKIQREAFHDNWITISKPAVIKFSSGDDSELERNELINLSVTGKASLSGNTETAGSGSSLNLEVYSGDTVSLVPNVTVNGEPDTTVVWDKSKYSSYMTEGKDGKMTFKVPSGSVGTTYTFDAYCKADKGLWVTVALTVVSPEASETTGSTASGGGTSTAYESGEPGMVLAVSKAGGGSVANASFGIADNNRIYVVEVPKGTTATYEVRVSTSDSSPVGTKVSIDTISDVVFDNTNNTVSGTTISRTISCSSINDDFMPFEVTIKFQII